MGNNITLCAIMLNEEKYLPAFLNNVKGFFDDYVFVDGGSTDKSIELVEQAGYKVHQIPFKMDFGRQKNRALGLAKTEWRMFMDIDENLSKGLQLLFKFIVAGSALQGHVMAFLRDNFLDGLPIDNFPLDLQVRLFDDSVFYKDNVHELPDTGGKTIVRCWEGRLYHKKDSYKQYRANLIYELIRRGVTEMPPVDEGAYMDGARLRKVKLIPEERKIVPLDEYIDGPYFNK